MDDTAVTDKPLPLSLIIALTEKAGVLPKCTMKEAALLADFMALGCNWCASQGAYCTFPDCPCAGGKCG